MKINSTLRTVASIATLMISTPSIQAEQPEQIIEQRDCVGCILKNPSENMDANRQRISTLGTDDSDSNKFKNELTPDSAEAKAMFSILKTRFTKSSDHYKQLRGSEGLRFTDIKKALKARPDLLYILNRMEVTGGAPDIIAVEDDAFVFADISEESPKGRRNLDYDQAKKMADEMGVEMINEAIYRNLQAYYVRHDIILDNGTWIWLLTDAKTRTAGDALIGWRMGFCVYVDRESASYRTKQGGWRGILRVPKFNKANQYSDKMSQK